MSITTIIFNKELLKFGDKLNILWTPVENQSFVNFIENLGHHLLFFETLYYGSSQPHLIVCNNKISYFEQVKLYSLKLHLPVLIIDHSMRSAIVDSERADYINNIPSSYSIALNKEIHDSWDKCHDQILDYNDSVTNKNIWNNILYQTAKKVFLL